MSKTSLSNNDILIKTSIANTRLPCRGCTVGCKNYNHCGGLLWRMNSGSSSIGSGHPDEQYINQTNNLKS